MIVYVVKEINHLELIRNVDKLHGQTKFKYVVVPTEFVWGIVTAFITCFGKRNSIKALIGVCLIAPSHTFLIINRGHGDGYVKLNSFSTLRFGVAKSVSHHFDTRTVLPGTAVAKWLRSCATNRNVAGSLPAGVIGIFHWHKILSNPIWPWGRISL